jgi:hypothetical protein
MAEHKDKQAELYSDLNGPVLDRVRVMREDALIHAGWLYIGGGKWTDPVLGKEYTMDEAYRRYLEV